MNCITLSLNGSLLLAAGLILSTAPGAMADWARFRGPNGSGVAADSKPVPTTWSEDKNIAWQLDMPGPGTSAPIIVGDKVFVTCWTGYAEDDQNASGKLEDLKRNLICVDRKTGKILWNKAVKAKLPEDPFSGMFTNHGYASHTPVSDGERVYAFFGKSGVHAFDMAGKKLWSKDVGDGRDQRGWGSAASPILAGDKLIVTASIESNALIALDKNTGKEIWNSAADVFSGIWGTPILAGPKGKEEIVLAINGEVWGVNPESGKLNWYAQGLSGRNATISMVESDGVVFGLGSRGSGSMAIKAGGKDDVGETHTVWEGKDGPNIITPVVHGGRLYWATGSLAYCRDAKTGEEIYTERLPGASASSGGRSGGFGGGRPGGDRQPGGPGGQRAGGRPGGDRQPGGPGGQRAGGPGGQRGGGPGGGRSGGGGGGRFGGSDYASPIAAGGHLFALLGTGEMIVVKLGDEFKFVGRNKLGDTGERFTGSPAADDGQLFIRSSKRLYCIAE